MASPKDNGSKKSSAKKNSAKKNSAKKSSAQKTSAKKSTPRNSPTTGKASSKKTAAGKAPAAKKSPPSNRARNMAIALGAGAVAAVTAVVAVRAVRNRAASAGTCTIKNCGDVSGIVIDFLVSEGFNDASEASTFPDDIPASKNLRKTWAKPLKTLVEARGCQPGAFGSADCAKAKKVGDIVAALCASVKKANGIA